MSTFKVGNRLDEGFTIVELLIVIVVIGILAAIVVIAYNGVTMKARNNARLAEVESWTKLFEAYRASNGSFPAISDGTYCLGVGFPSDPGGGNVPRCRDYQGTWATSYLESDGATVTNALAGVGRVPASTKYPVAGVVGPYAYYNVNSGGTITIIGWFDGNAASDCPAPMSFNYAGGNGAVACQYILRSS